MKKILLCVLLASASHTHAYNYFPLTPSWFGSLIDNIAEDKREVWRGQVTQALSPTRVIIQDHQGRSVQVDLLHLTPRKNANAHQSAISSAHSEALVGKRVYVLGKAGKDKISAKLIDVAGEDINLYFASIGAFDINTTSLMNKPEKQQYINAANNAKRSGFGIWK